MTSSEDEVRVCTEHASWLLNAEDFFHGTLLVEMSELRRGDLACPVVIPLLGERLPGFQAARDGELRKGSK
jgi:hypothetical protein